MGGSAGNASNGFVAALDASETAKAFMVVDTDGRGFVVADVKSFRTPNPGQSRTDIVYAAIEGPEAAAYVRGTAACVRVWPSSTCRNTSSASPATKR
jgi:hypothetical protein